MSCTNCPSCQNLTVEDAPVCTHCGYELMDAGELALASADGGQSRARFAPSPCALRNMASLGAGASLLLGVLCLPLGLNTLAIGFLVLGLGGIAALTLAGW